jgi:hypothetical protein
MFFFTQERGFYINSSGVTTVEKTTKFGPALYAWASRLHKSLL